jgi:hypothetical protein
MNSSDVLLSHSQVSEKPQQVIEVNDSSAILTNPQFGVISGNFSVTIRALKQHINSPSYYTGEAAKYEFLRLSLAAPTFLPMP